MLAQNALGERGYVPSNYVQRLSSTADRVKTPTPSGKVTQDCFINLTITFDRNVQFQF